MSQTHSSESRTASERHAKPALEVEFRLQPNVLTLEYKVKNTRNHAIYLFNVIWDLDSNGGYVRASLPLYACMKQGAVLHLAKTILPLPRNRKVYLRIVPFVTKVEAGSIFEETLQMPLPLPEHNVYFPARPDSKYKLIDAHSVVLSLQFIEDMPDIEAEPAPLPNAIFLQHPKLFPLVETVQSEPQPLRVPVNKRQDEFEEF